MSEYVTEAVARAQRRARERQLSLPQEIACIEDPTGVLLAPTADIQITEFANATVATTESEEWIKSNVVVDREAWC